MALFNRLVAALLWLILLVSLAYVAVAPLGAVNQAQFQLGALHTWLQGQRAASPTEFVVGQIAFGVGAILVMGTLLVLELWPGQRRGVRVRTAEGGSVELDTQSVSRRLEWHLDQLAEIISVVPAVKSKGGSVDIRLEVETAPDVDVPMKTNEVVEVTRDLIEEEMGLKLGKLDVHMRYAPYEPDWVG